MKTFFRTISGLAQVFLATIMLYVAIVGTVTLIPFGGKPMIQRLVPLQNPGGPSHSLVRFREAERQGPVDIVFLGASHTYRGFDPRLFADMGYTSLNLGSSSQTPLNTLAVLERHLEALRPKLVIYEIYQTALGIDGMESYYDLLSNTPVDLSMLEMAWNVRQPQAWTALLSTTIRNWRTPLSSHVQHAKEGRDDLYIKGGFVQTRALMPAERLTRLKSGLAPVKFSMDPRQFRFLGDCIEMVHRQGAVFVACSYPIPIETRKALLGYEENRRVISDFLSRYGAAYRDFNVDMTLDTAIHYYDEVHLNQAGVELFHAALVQWLRQENILPLPSQSR